MSFLMGSQCNMLLYCIEMQMMQYVSYITFIILQAIIINIFPGAILTTFSVNIINKATSSTSLILKLNRILKYFFL